MSDVKQVKVDNWGIYFLQRLKHFFNRTDYCDLTLQFQDNAQLKVHRLVLSACTEYFELLERTCEMYEDCLVMPDDLQADVVVPIVNFMYTGHLEFRMDLLERLYQTSQILNMPVLTKLLESHRSLMPKATLPTHSYSGVKRFSKNAEFKSMKSSTSTSQKRSYSRAFENIIVHRDKKNYQTISKSESLNNISYCASSLTDSYASQKLVLGDPRPTRYELPEELDTGNVFDNSFCDISYTSQPLMVHPDTVKRYSAKRSGLFNEASSSKKCSGMSTVDIVECKRIVKDDNIFDDSIPEHNLSDETEMFHTSYTDTVKDTNQLFDQILEHNDGPKVTIESKDSKAASNLDHARIISEVLKKYPHLVKSNKSIKLKILDPVPGKGRKQQKPSPTYVEEKQLKLKAEVESDFTYETDVIDSKQAAKLIAMGAENTKGPWICLICGTPGKALHFSSYYKFRRHLVDVHNEKPVSNICEYCGLRSLKRNYLLHHLYSQHGVQPPPQYHFPKCNLCSYIALTEGLLVKHKFTHKDIRNFRCNVCSSSFTSSNQLLAHIQSTGHKYSAEKKSNLQCIYCLKVFLRETNLYAHIKTHHKKEAKNDCIIEDSDDEKGTVEIPRTKVSTTTIKFEPSTSYDNEYEDVDLQYQIQQRPVSDIQVVARKQHVISNSKQKILNPGFSTPKTAQKAKPSKNNQPMHNEIFQDINILSSSDKQNDEIVVIDNNEYIMRDHQLIPRKRKSVNSVYTLPNMVEPASSQSIQQPTTSVEFASVQNTNTEENVLQQPSMIIKKSANINQPIQIVVSNEEEYKALMASNHPIIFDNGETNKTLAVLHHNPAMDTTAIDLDNSQSNNMMIIPNEYPLNVTEAISTENSNIVVVYSQPVDDQNKQFQILTTSGIGAQFVQSSAIISQNYETVTTSTPVMRQHCIETQVRAMWPDNVQSREGNQIQLPVETQIQNMHESDHIAIKSVYNETGNNIDELPEVTLAPEPPKLLSPQVTETSMTLSQSDIVNTEHVDQDGGRDMEEESQNISHVHIETNVPSESVILEEPTTITVNNEPVETHPQTETIANILTNNDNISIIEETMETENVIEQPIETEKVVEQLIVTANTIEQPLVIENTVEQLMVTENAIERPMVTENIIEQPLVTENIIEQPMVTENIIEQPMVTENIIEQPMVTENIIEQPIVTENIIEQPMVTENIIEQPMETESVIEQTPALQNEELIPEQEHPADTLTITENLEIVVTDNPDTSEDQQSEGIESQAYDDIVEINHVNEVEPIYAKEAEEKIQTLTSEWSEDEYDVVEDNNTCQIVEKVSNEVLQNQVIVSDPSEVEESIENIQQEMNKQMAAEQSAVSSTEEDSSSQEMQLPQLTESPVHTMVSNPQAQQKISSLLNDWEDNESQEEITTVIASTPEETNVNVPQQAEGTNIDLPVTTEQPVQVPKTDNIKSLVSDWDDDEEEAK